MGKIRAAKRARVARPRPVSRPEAGGDVDTNGAGDAGTADTISTIVEQLKSPSSEERESGCATFSQLLSGRLTVETLARHRLVRLLGPLLVDPCLTVRQAAAGALRNLSMSGGNEGCHLMLEQDVLTPLLAAFNKLSEGWKPQRKLEKLQVLLDAESETFIQITNLLWNLCEYSDRAVNAVSKSGVVCCLLRCLDLTVYPTEVVVAAGQCLHVLTEENEPAAELLRPQLSILRSLATVDGDDSSRILLRVLASGILINVCPGGDSKLRPGHVVALAARTLASDARDLSIRITSNTEATDYEMQLADISLLVTAQQVCLEILTDLSGGDDSSDGWADQEDIEELNEDEEDFCDPMDECEWRDDPTQFCLSSEFQEAVVGEGLLPKIQEKLDSLPVDVTDVLVQTSVGQQVIKGLGTLRCRALLCLSNLVAALDVSDVGGAERLADLWRHIAQLVFSAGTECDVDLVEAAATAMRATLQKLLDSGQRGPPGLSVADLQPMAARVAACEDDAGRAGLVRTVGLLGCLRVRGQHRLSEADTLLVQDIGRLLTEWAASDASLCVCAESLDVLMDLFGEDCTDLAAVNIQLVAKLRAAQPSFKEKVSQQRQSLGQHFPLVATVRTNLPRFIKYKAARCRTIPGTH